MLLKTRDKILEATITAFNEQGYSNVSMQKLAENMGLSPGNLTYHFRKKEDLMIALYDLFREEMSLVIPPPDQNTPDSFKLDDQIKDFYKLQQRFLFFYLDLLEIERAYPVIAEQHYIHIQNQIKALETGLNFNIGRGIIAEIDALTTQHLAQQIWMTAVFWPRQARVRGLEDSLEDMRQTIWRQISPYLTSTGIKEVNEILKLESTQQLTL